MVIGAIGLSAPFVSTEVIASVVLIGVFVAEVVSVIIEIIVVFEMIAINNLFPTATATVSVKHPSKHNIY